MLSMIRCLIGWLGAGLVALTLTAAVAAQTPPKQPPTPTAPTQPNTERGPPVGAYAFAILGTLLVLAVVCMRTRKP